MMPSINRMMTLSSLAQEPCQQAEQKPIVVVTTATRTPTVSEIRVPFSVRDSV